MVTIFILTNEWRRDHESGHAIVGAYTSIELARNVFADKVIETKSEHDYDEDYYDDVVIEEETDDSFTIQCKDWDYYDIYEIIETPIDELNVA